MVDRSRISRPVIDTGTDTLVQQHFAEEVDINTIVKRFGITRDLPFGPEAGVYGDFTGITDYASAVEKVRSTEAAFLRLPADFREKFGNDPGQLVSYVEGMSEEELAAAMKPPEAAPAPPVAPVAPSGGSGGV